MKVPSIDTGRLPSFFLPLGLGGRADVILVVLQKAHDEAAQLLLDMSHDVPVLLAFRKLLRDIGRKYRVIDADAVACKI